MTKEVYVAGSGIISALGNNVAETLSSFDKHQSGIAAIRHLKTRYRDELPLGEIKLSNEELAQINDLPLHLSRTILISYHAAKEALQPFSKEVLASLQVGFISGSTVGGMDKSEHFFEHFQADANSGDLKEIIHHDCGKATDYVAEKLGIKGFVSTFSTACSSSANAIMLGARMIKANQLDVVIAGGVDALTRFTLNGFKSLMIVDNEQCRPFNENRAGLNLGEGAAYVVLMNEKALKQLNAEVLCRVTGYCNVNDSHHPTALSDEGNGPYHAMLGALKKSGISASDVSYINLHGTGTQNNDQSEGKAVERLFHPHYPKLSTTKSFTGHTLGASGAMEAVFSALAIKHDIIFPNYNFKEAISTLHIYPETSLQKGSGVKHVLSNSFGFGGNCTSLVFSK